MEEQQAAEEAVKHTQFKQAKNGEARLADTKLMSMSLAMIMAVVAMLGAVTAYRAALAEQETLRIERRLQQGEMLELVHRQELLSKLSSRTRYENSVAQHTPAVEGGQQESGSLTAADRRQAALKKLQAEEELAHVRSFAPYLNYFYVDFPYRDLEPSVGVEVAVAKDTAEWLRALGFDTVWESQPDGSFTPIWKRLDDEVGLGRHKVLLLAVAVVLFVVALAFLTFAQLSHRRPARERLLAWIGVALSVTGLAIAMWGDRSSWKDFLLFTAGFGVLALIGAPLARKFHFAARAEAEESAANCVPVAAAESAEDVSEEEEDEPVHPAEVEPALFAGMRLHTAPVAHKFGRFVISMIALSAVLSALSGYFYSHAAVASSRAASAALDSQAELFRMKSRQVTLWNNRVGRLATAEDYHIRYEAARQRLELAKEQPSLLSVQDASEQVQRRLSMLQKLEKQDPKIHELMTGPLGPEQDVNFPRKLVISKSEHDPARAFARWSASNELSLGHQKEATAFLSLLTLFAIALYLLGQALGMGRTSAAFILVVFACALVSVGVLRGLVVGIGAKPITLQPAAAECRLPDSIPDDNLIELAAEHFARGWTLSEGWSDDPKTSNEAAREFGCAAQIRPTFAAAKLYFARATNRANTPQLNEGAFVSLISKKSLPTVSQAEGRAIDLLTQQGFAPPIDLVGDYGFDTYASGLVNGDLKTVELGRQGTLAAIRLRPDDPMAYFNRGLAELAEGQEQQALKTYQHTIAMGDPGKPPYVTGDAAMIGGAITDLDVFRQYCRDLNNAAYCTGFETTDLPKLKSEMVAAAWPVAPGRTPAGSGIKLTGLNLWGSSGGLGWSGNVEHPSSDSQQKSQDSIAVLWYAHDREWDAWRVLPAISEQVNPAYYTQGYAKIYYSVLKASDARICLQSGKYRAEFYVNGEFAVAKDITLEHEKVSPGVFPDLNVALCYPASWQSWKPQDQDAVWTRGFIGDGHNRGVFVFSFFDPQQSGEEASKEDGLRRAENLLKKEGLTAGAIGKTQLYECAGLQTSPRELMAAFADNGSVSLAKAWTTTEGLVNVVVVVDKNTGGTALDKQSAAQSPARQDCEILMSATTVQQ